jgi:ABC-type sugar transport system permease subunit
VSQQPVGDGETSAGAALRPTIMVPAAARGPVPVVLGLVFLLPALVLLVTSFVEPAVWTIRSGFQRLDGFGPPKGVGTQNYEQVINGEFWSSFGFALVLGLVPLLLLLLVAPALAWAAHRTGRTGRWVTRGLLCLPLALFTPAGLALAWLVYRRPEAADPGAAKAAVVGAAAVTLSGVIVAAGVTAYLAALRRRDPRRSPWPALLAVAALAVLGTLAVALQAFTYPWAITGGGPARSTQTPMLQIFDLGFRRFEFGAASAMSTVLLAVLAVLGLLAAAVVIVTRLRLELDGAGRSADAVELGPVGSGTGPVAVIVGGVLLLAVLALSLSGHLPLLRGLFNGAEAPGELSGGRIVANTYLPSFLSAVSGVLAAALAGFGIGALRPLGRWSELLLLPFAPFLFVGAGPLAIRGYDRIKDVGAVDSFVGVMSPILLVIPVLFVFALLGRGQEIRAQEIRRSAGRVPWARTYLLPALPMLAVSFAVTWLVQSQDLLWQLVTGLERFMSGPVVAAAARGQFGTDADRIPFDLALPPTVAVLTLLAAVAAQLLYLDRLALRVGRPEHEIPKA